MSEKRFTINLEDECIDDAEERIFISFLDRIDFYELCAFLNEQQSIIDEQKIAIDEMITDYKNLKKENEQLRKENFFLDYWKRKAMILLMQVRRLTPRMTDKEVMEFSKELEDE